MIVSKILRLLKNASKQLFCSPSKKANVATFNKGSKIPRSISASPGTTPGADSRSFSQEVINNTEKRREEKRTPRSVIPPQGKLKPFHFKNFELIIKVTAPYLNGLSSLQPTTG